MCEPEFLLDQDPEQPKQLYRKRAKLGALPNLTSRLAIKFQSSDCRIATRTQWDNRMERSEIDPHIHDLWFC